MSHRKSVVSHVAPQWNATLRRKDPLDGPVSVLKHYMRHELNIGWHTASAPHPLAGVSTSGIFGSRARRRRRAPPSSTAPSSSTGCSTDQPAVRSIVILMPRNAAHVQAMLDVSTWMCQPDPPDLARCAASFTLPPAAWFGLGGDTQAAHAWLQQVVCDGMCSACPALHSIMLVVWWDVGTQLGGVWLSLAGGTGVTEDCMREAVAQARTMTVKGLIDFVHT